MKHAIIIAAVLSIAATAQTETSSLRVEEVFSVETSEELEASLTGGYPMPWLAEILEDKTIPEEDRYWLDCRVRAAIAIEFHTFFDRNGNSVAYDAEWIMPGENYWRESFTVNLPGCEYGTLPFNTRSDWRVDPGITVNSYGEHIGEFVHSGVASRLNTSRDGTISAGAFPTGNGYQPVLLYSDATYFISPISMGFGMCGISNSGNYVIVSSAGKTDWQTGEETPPQAILLNRNGEILWETELEMTPVGNISPVISPNDEVCVIPTQAESFDENGIIKLSLQAFDMNTGAELWRVDNPSGLSVSFSPDGQLAFIPREDYESSAVITSTGEEIWSDSKHPFTALVNEGIRYLTGSNRARVISAVIMPPDSRYTEWYLALFNSNGQTLYLNSNNRNMNISPNGSVVITDNYNPRSEAVTTLPFSIARIPSGGE
ncbi:MAG: PQQ-binding-like beta-propeller repeat protein [Candidatus Sabulitectum sp.]|nr:PQQ-binding-like beta-propeller repeat protein [Candidatus Sabulitectum sp.]